MEINLQGLEKFLTQFQKTVEEAKEVKAELVSLLERVEKTEATVEDTKKATARLVLATEIDPTEMEELISVFAPWKIGETLAVGDIRRYEGKLYKCIQGHKTQGDWTPSGTPSLFTLYTPKSTEEGEEIVPDFVQPTGAHDAYKKGDKVAYSGKIYESVIDNNTYSPEDYPQGWKEV